VAFRIEPHLQGLEDPLEDLGAAPGVEVVIDRLPGSVAFRQIAPRRAAAQYPEDAVEHDTRRDPPTPGCCRRRDVRFDHSPLFIRDFVASHPFDPPSLAFLGEWEAFYGLRPFSDRA